MDSQETTSKSKKKKVYGIGLNYVMFRYIPLVMSS